MAKIHYKRTVGRPFTRKQYRKRVVAIEKDRRRMLSIFNQLSIVDQHKVLIRAKKNAIQSGYAGLTNWLSLAYEYAKQITDTIAV